MRGYGLPRNHDVAGPDCGDINTYGLKSSAGHLPGPGGDILIFCLAFFLLLTSWHLGSRRSPCQPRRLLRSRLDKEYFILKPEEVTPEYHAWHKHMRVCIDYCGAGQRCAVGQALLDACPLPGSRKAHQ